MIPVLLRWFFYSSRVGCNPSLNNNTSDLFEERNLAKFKSLFKEPFKLNFLNSFAENVLLIPSFIFIHFRRSRAWTTRSTKPWRRSTRWRSSASSSSASPRSRSCSLTSGSSLSQEVTSRDDFYIICVDWQPLAQSRSHPWSIFSGSSPIWASGWVIRSP